MRRAVPITGASTGIGGVYSDRFARRGHDLVLVARNVDRMTTLPERRRSETSVNVDVVPADLTEEQDLARVEQRLREDARIGVLINNAGTAIPKEGLYRARRRRHLPTDRAERHRTHPTRQCRYTSLRASRRRCHRQSCFLDQPKELFQVIIAGREAR